MKVRVHIRRNADGAVQITEHEYPDDHELHTVEFHWNEGNYACDSNREIFFNEAAKLPRPDRPHACDEGLFDILRIEADTPGGTMVLDLTREMDLDEDGYGKWVSA